MRFSMTAALLPMTLMILLAGCSGSSSDSKKALTDETGQKVQGNSTANGCVFSFTDGEEAPSTLPSRDVKVTRFGKELDLSRLQAVGHASARSTYEFMKRDGVDAYHVRQDKEEACLLFRDIPAVTSELSQKWNEADEGKNTLLGLFMPFNRVQSLGSSRPVIMLRVDTDRYTLMHEYMHFVFNEMRERRGYSDGELMSRYKRQITEFKLRYDLMDADATKERVSAFVDAWVALGKTTIEVTENFALEEMTIESVLQDAEKAGQLSHVNDRDRENSPAYLLSSAKSALETYAIMKDDVFDAIQKVLTENNDWGRKAQVYELQSKVRDRKNEISRLVLAYGNESQKTSLATALSAASTHVHGHDCGHMKSFEEQTGGKKITEAEAARILDGIKTIVAH